jgi:hypothetical protein
VPTPRLSELRQLRQQVRQWDGGLETHSAKSASETNLLADMSNTNGCRTFELADMADLKAPGRVKSANAQGSQDTGRRG